MKWVSAREQLPKRDQEVIIQVHHYDHQVCRAKFDRTNPFIKDHEKGKFWERGEKNDFKSPPFEVEEVSFWIPFPRYDWEK